MWGQQVVQACACPHEQAPQTQPRNLSTAQSRINEAHLCLLQVQLQAGSTVLLSARSTSVLDSAVQLSAQLALLDQQSGRLLQPGRVALARSSDKSEVHKSQGGTET